MYVCEQNTEPQQSLLGRLLVTFEKASSNSLAALQRSLSGSVAEEAIRSPSVRGKLLSLYMTRKGKVDE